MQVTAKPFFSKLLRTKEIIAKEQEIVFCGRHDSLSLESLFGYYLHWSRWREIPVLRAELY